MQVSAAINQGAAVFGKAIPQKHQSVADDVLLSKYGNSFSPLQCSLPKPSSQSISQKSVNDNNFTKAMLNHTSELMVTKKSRGGEKHRSMMMSPPSRPTTRTMGGYTSELIVSQSRDDVDLAEEEREARADDSDDGLLGCPEEEYYDHSTYDWRNVMKQIRADPSLARDGSEGILPLHAACGDGAPISVIKMLLKIYPQAAQAKSDDGYLPLMCHLLMQSDSPSEDIVSVLLDSFPRAAAIGDENNQLPIHAACMATGVSKNIFTMLLRAYPQGAYVCDVEGFYPVDYAAKNKDAATRKFALASLIANDPEEFRGHYEEENVETEKITMVTDINVDLLLNGPGLATNSRVANVTDDIIDDILTSFTFGDETQEAPPLIRATSYELASVSSVIDEKSLLLHLQQCLGSGSSPSQAIMTTLMERYPTSARVTNAKNQLPIHLACKTVDFSQAMFAMLLCAYPQGAYASDVDGMCPIDYAVSNKNQSVRKAAVAALVESDKQVHMSPSSSSPADTTSTISERNEPAPHKEQHAPEVEKTLLHHLEHCLEHNLSPSKAIVTKITETYPASALVTNAKNQLPIHLACMATGVSENIMSQLLIAYPGGAFLCDGNGMCPIDYAVSNRDVTTRKSAIAALSQNDATVRFMRDSSAPIKPESSSGDKDFGFCACGDVDNTDDGVELDTNALQDLFARNSSPPEDIVLFVIESDPDVARAFNAYGQLPLHHACMAERVSVNTYAYILGAYPEGAYVPDKFGKYPIDYAAENKDVESRINAFAALLQNDRKITVA